MILIIGLDFTKLNFLLVWEWKELGCSRNRIGSKKFNKGDKVASSMPLGSYSDERIIPKEIAVKIISDKVACELTKGLTHYLLYKTYKVRAGETILFHAAAGGVGQIFCQWAKSIGCKVIGTVGSDR